jgi:hypothetical protein|uniref:Uncharacterized protein n=1 Tax=viral metagenome TaxID=1070528 RepID=A0A6C0IP95_9ZZZZ
MNITINESKFNIKNAALMESKKNIVMDGFFTKLNYLSEWFTMNGLYFSVSLDHKLVVMGDKTMMNYDPYSSNNLSVMKFLSFVEHKLLDMYCRCKHKHLHKNTLFTKQLYSGYLKVITNDTKKFVSNKRMWCIKISGIWETSEEVGITYKVFESIPINS